MAKKSNLLTFIVLAILLTSCGSRAGGPASWIDAPLADSTFPLEAAITIQAHASSEKGVDRIQFYIDDEMLQSVSVAGDRLGNASIEWTPANEGTFLIKVQSFDTAGKPGAFAQKTIHVVSQQAFSLITPEPGLFLEPTPSVQAQLVETTFARINHVECGADGVVYADIAIGNPQGIGSFKLFSTWVQAEAEETFNEPYPQFIQKRVQIREPQDEIDRDHQIGLRVHFVGVEEPFLTHAYEPGNRCPGHYQPVAGDPGEIAPLITAKQNSNCRAGTGSSFAILGTLLEGQTAPVEGRSRDSNWLRISAPGSGQACWIAANLVDVEGDLETVPIEVTPTPPQATATSAPAASPTSDSSPPQINSVGVSPSSILTPGGGCPSDPRTATVTVNASDPSGISQVLVFWNLQGDSGQSALTDQGGGTWQGQAGPVSKVGTMTLFVNAEDNAGNDALSDTYNVTVQNCPG